MNLVTDRQINDDGITESKYFTHFRKLLLSYAAAIRGDIITKNRNELIYEIASSQLEYYIQWLMKRNIHEKTASFFLLYNITFLNELFANIAVTL